MRYVMMKKKYKYIIGIVVLSIFAALTGGSFYMLDYALYNGGRIKGNRLEEQKAHYPEIKAWLDSVERGGYLRDTFVVMPTGEKHHAVFLRSAVARGNTALLVHGYKGRGADMLYIARIYNKELGYNVLMPDLHGHGQSYGDDVQMGWKDRLDVLHWAEVAEGMFAKGHGGVRILVHGVSMGAATTMCVAGERTPGYMKCFVEDCGYTSAWDEFAHELRNRFGLPPFPLMYTTSALCGLRHGWTFSEASPLAQVAKCHKPMLFIHGGDDDFVPTWMVRPLYAAKPAPKELWVAQGSGHAHSYQDHKEQYARRICAFAAKWMK